MTRAADYVVCYDITDDRERDRADRVLKGYGFRIQKSVFEATLTRWRCEALLRDLTALNLQTGNVLIYRRMSGARRIAVGDVAPPPDDAVAYVV